MSVGVADKPSAADFRAPAPINSACDWPLKVDLFGVKLSPIDCNQACEAIINATRQGIPGIVSAFSVHAVIEAVNSTDLRLKVNNFSVVVPDGQPVRWALNWLHGTRLISNVRGSDLMWRLCERAASEGISVYLYGGSNEALRALRANLQKALPSLRIAGAESPPFRPLTPDEDARMVDRVNASGAGLVFIGLGCPKQDYFAAAHAEQIKAVQLCVGAAFDFHAGTKAVAPLWMQRYGLEWLFRISQEPGRLWKRYLVTNTRFLMLLIYQLMLSAVGRINFWGHPESKPASAGWRVQ